MSEIDKNFSYTDRTKEYMKRKSSGNSNPEPKNEPEKVSSATPKKVTLFPSKKDKDDE